MRRLLVAVLLFAPLVAPARQGEDGVRTVEYRKESGCSEIRGAGKRVVVSPAQSGAIVCYGFDGNLLRESPEDGGTGQFGEASCIDLSPATPSAGGPWTPGPPGPSRVTLIAPPRPVPGGSIRVEKEVGLDPRSGDLQVVIRATAPAADALTPMVARSRLALPPGGYALSPTHPSGRYRAAWALARAAAGGYDGDTPSDPRVHAGAGGLVAECRGAPYQAVTDSGAGWAAYVHGRTLLVLRFSGVARMVTGDGGWNVAIGMSDGAAELTVRSPEMRLRRTATYSFPIRWSITRLPSEVKSVAQAQSLLQELAGRYGAGR